METHHPEEIHQKEGPGRLERRHSAGGSCCCCRWSTRSLIKDPISVRNPKVNKCIPVKTIMEMHKSAGKRTNILMILKCACQKTNKNPRTPPTISVKDSV